MAEDAGMGKLSAVRTKAGLAVIGGALLLTGVGVGASVAASSPGTRPASDTSAITVTTDAPTTEAVPVTSAAASTTAAPVATRPATATASSPRAATVTRVTSPDSSTAAPDPAAEYTPTQESRPPGAPQGVIGGPLPPAAPLPGEPGYVAPEPTPAG